MGVRATSCGRERPRDARVRISALRADSLRVRQRGYGGHITPAAARLGLEWYAEHTQDALAHPGKHPNIDRLLAWAEGSESYRVQTVAA